MIHLWGIPQCSSVKKIISPLKASALAFTFHNYDKEPVAPERIRRWLNAVGSGRLINPSAASWKSLSAEERSLARGDIEKTLALLTINPRICRRPIIEWPDGTITVGVADGLAKFEKTISVGDTE